MNAVLCRLFIFIFSLSKLLVVNAYNQSRNVTRETQQIGSQKQQGFLLVLFSEERAFNSHSSLIIHLACGQVGTQDNSNSTCSSTSVKRSMTFNSLL